MININLLHLWVIFYLVSCSWNWTSADWSSEALISLQWPTLIGCGVVCMDNSINAEKTFALYWQRCRIQHFVRNLPSSKKYAAISFLLFKGIHFSWFEWKTAKFVQLTFQSKCWWIISEHSYFFKFVFIHFARLMLHLMTNHQS